MDLLSILGNLLNRDGSQVNDILPLQSDTCADGGRIGGFTTPSSSSTETGTGTPTADSWQIWCSQGSLQEGELLHQIQGVGW